MVIIAGCDPGLTCGARLGASSMHVRTSCTPCMMAACCVSNLLLPVPSQPISCQVFTSILFLAGMFSSFFAGYVTRHWGRKATMVRHWVGGHWVRLPSLVFWQHAGPHLPKVLSPCLCFLALLLSPAHPLSVKVSSAICPYWQLAASGSWLVPV